MCTVILSLISGLVGSLLGSFIALDAVRRTEYLRNVAAFKRMLRDISAALNSTSGHPAAILNSRINELNPIYDDVIRHASCWRKSRIRLAWERLAIDAEAKKQLDMITTPVDYTKSGTLDAKKLIKERISALISVL